jgi:hypothetical protein
MLESAPNSLAYGSYSPNELLKQKVRGGLNIANFGAKFHRKTLIICENISRNFQ